MAQTLPACVDKVLVDEVLADEAVIAVATNFQRTAEKLAEDFESRTDHTLSLTSGSTGKLYAQIRHGAPYDIFLAADQARPARLENSPYAVAGSRFTYAQGALVLIHADNQVVDKSTLQPDNIRRIAIAHPDLAPYGRAAQESLTQLGLWDRLKPKIVTGENIGQTYTLVYTGNAELGLVALSSVIHNRQNYWPLPSHLHTPIKQDALLLTKGADNIAAQAFMDYLKSPAGLSIIAQAGYSLDAHG